MLATWDTLHQRGGVDSTWRWVAAPLRDVGWRND